MNFDSDPEPEEKNIIARMVAHCRYLIKSQTKNICLFDKPYCPGQRFCNAVPIMEERVNKKFKFVDQKGGNSNSR